MKNTIENIIKQMTFEEKAMLLTGGGAMNTKSFEKYGVESKNMADGPHGTRLEKEKNCTHFPNICSLAASWNVENARKMGEALANDCIEHNIDMLLAPGINIKRTPYCGRNFEYFSEDPVVSGEMGAAYINGLQGKGIACSLKHFAANNQEKYRQDINVEIDERTLREIYLKGFEIAVKKSKPESMMCSYNKINAVWCSENPLILNEILKEEWEYEGFVISDWGAVLDIVKSVKCGLDLQMPMNENIFNELKVGVEKGKISMNEIDNAVRRMLKFTLKKKAVADKKYDRNEQHKSAKEIASEGIVLLKNENNALPLDSKKYKKIAVIGEFADKPLVSGQGSAEVYQGEAYTDSPLGELKKLMPDTEFVYKEIFKKGEYSNEMIWPVLYGQEFIDFTTDADAVIVFAGSMESEDTEGLDRRSIELNPNYKMTIEFALKNNKNVIVVLQTGSAVILDDWKDRTNAIVQMWLSGEAGGSAIAEVLCGVVNPSGKLPETFPKRPRIDMDYPGNRRVVDYKEKLDVGYRYYDKHPEEICYPFGYGLSYTEFEYKNLEITKKDDKYQVKFTVKNTGKYDGADVVQLYISDVVSTVVKPIKELKQFKKIYLKQGEEKEVVFELTEKDFEYYNVSLHKWVVENGEYKILIGASSRDICLEEAVVIDDKMPYSIHKKGEAMIG